MRIHIGHDLAGQEPQELGTVELNKAGEIEITNATSDEAHDQLAHLLASMYHDRYADETALFHSLPSRLNNGYMWARMEHTADSDPTEPGTSDKETLDDIG